MGGNYLLHYRELALRQALSGLAPGTPALCTQGRRTEAQRGHTVRGWGRGLVLTLSAAFPLRAGGGDPGHAQGGTITR